MLRKLLIVAASFAAIVSTLVWGLLLATSLTAPIVTNSVVPGIVVALVLGVSAGLVLGAWRRDSRQAVRAAALVALVACGPIVAARLYNAGGCDRLKELETACTSGDCASLEAYRSKLYREICAAQPGYCRYSPHGYSFQLERSHIRHQLICEVGIQNLCAEGSSSCDNGYQRRCTNGQWGPETRCPTGSCASNPSMRSQCELVF